MLRHSGRWGVGLIFDWIRCPSLCPSPASAQSGIGGAGPTQDITGFASCWRQVYGNYPETGFWDVGRMPKS